jgi:hypothetical protein
MSVTNGGRGGAKVRMQRDKRMLRCLLVGLALLLLALPVQAYPAPDVAWHFTNHVGDATDLAIGDLTGDGVADVAFIDTAHPADTVFVLYGHNGTVYWHNDAVAGYAIAVGDVDGDSANEVIAGNASNWGLTVFERDGAFKFFYPTDSPVTDIELGDIDGDDTADIIACDPRDDGWIYVINGTGVNVTGWPVGNLPGAIVDIALGNLDDAGGLDIAALSDGLPGTLYAFNSTGDRLWLNNSVGGRSVEIGDVDGDAEEEVVIGDLVSSHVYIYDGATGALESAFDTNHPPTEVELGELDGDIGNMEIAVITGIFADRTIFALDVTPTNHVNELWNFSIDWTPSYYGEGLAIGDVDRDGKNEVIAASTSANASALCGVWAFDGLDGNGDGKGDVVWMYELGPFPGSAANDLEVGDVDGDGDLDVLVGTNQGGGSVYALFTKEPAAAPFLTPSGIAALLGLLSTIAALSIRLRIRKRQ